MAAVLLISSLCLEDNPSVECKEKCTQLANIIHRCARWGFSLSLSLSLSLSVSPPRVGVAQQAGRPERLDTVSALTPLWPTGTYISDDVVIKIH